MLLCVLNLSLGFLSEPSFANTSGETQISVAGDLEMPVVNDITVDKTELTAPDSLMIDIDAYDADSGINSVLVHYYRESKGSMEYGIGAGFNQESGKYEARLSFDENCTDDVIYISSVSVTDNAKNRIQYTSNKYGKPASDDRILPIDISVRIIGGTAADLEFPIVRSVSVDKTQLNVPDSLTISVDAYDAGSGVNSVSVHYYRDSKESMEYGTEARFNQETGKYELCLSFDENCPDDIVYISSVIVEDNAKNSVRYTSNKYGKPASDDKILQDEISVKITASESGGDVQAPVINHVTADRKEVIVPDSLVFYVEASDDISGVNDVTIHYKRETKGTMQYGAGMTYNAELGKYEARLDFDEFCPNDKLYVVSVYLTDKEGNYITYTSKKYGQPASDNRILTEDICVPIINSIPEKDSIPPVLKGIYADKTEAESSDQINLSLEISDDISGFKTGMVYFKTDAGERISGKIEGAQDADIYAASIAFNDLKAGTTLSLDQITLEDHAGNMAVYKASEITGEEILLPFTVSITIKSLPSVPDSGHSDHGDHEDDYDDSAQGSDSDDQEEQEGMDEPESEAQPDVKPESDPDSGSDPEPAPEEDDDDDVESDDTDDDDESDDDDPEEDQDDDDNSDDEEDQNDDSDDLDDSFEELKLEDLNDVGRFVQGHNIISQNDMDDATEDEKQFIEGMLKELENDENADPIMDFSNVEINGDDLLKGLDADTLNEVAERLELDQDSLKDSKVSAQVYMDIRFSSVDFEDDEDRSFTLDLTPVMRPVLTYVKEGVTSTEPVGNAKKIDVTETVTVTIPLPDSYGWNRDELYVEHKGYVYLAKLSEKQGKRYLSFKNPHGFSEFTVRESNHAAAMIEDMGYLSFENAMNEAEDNAVINLLQPVNSNIMIERPLTFMITGCDFTGTIEIPDHLLLLKGDNGLYKISENSLEENKSESGSGIPVLWIIAGLILMMIVIPGIRGFKKKSL